MHSQQEVRVTTHDKLMRAWENSMELVRDFENYSHQVTDDRQANSQKRKACMPPSCGKCCWNASADRSIPAKKAGAKKWLRPF